MKKNYTYLSYWEGWLSIIVNILNIEATIHMEPLENNYDI